MIVRNALHCDKVDVLSFSIAIYSKIILRFST